jgi:phenylalanyl-tRNA synthetase beta chain
MRIMLVPNLIEVIARNQSHQMTDISVFEIGKIYSKTDDGEIDEKLSIAGAMVGSVWGNAWGLNTKSLAIDFYTCKGLVEALLNGLGIENAVFSPINHKMLHPTRGAEILISRKKIGIIGEASADFADVVGSRGRIYVYELDFNLIMKAARHKGKYIGLPKYPAVERHLTSLIPESVNYADIENALNELKLDLLEKVSLLDVYKGQNSQEKMQSITLSFIFRSVEKTLTEDDVNAVVNKIREIFTKTLKAEYKQ